MSFWTVKSTVDKEGKPDVDIRRNRSVFFLGPWRDLAEFFQPIPYQGVNRFHVHRLQLDRQQADIGVHKVAYGQKEELPQMRSKSYPILVPKATRRSRLLFSTTAMPQKFTGVFCLPDLKFSIILGIIKNLK